MSFPNNSDWNPHFYTSNLTPEGHLVRLNQLKGVSPAEIAFYLERAKQGWSTVEIISKFFDQPLTQLFEDLETAFADQRSLSPRSAQAYFERFRSQLTLTCAQFCRNEGIPLASQIDPAGHVGKTTLRQNLSSDPDALEQMANALGQRIEQLPFRWDSDETFDLFCRARSKDLYHYILRRVNFNRSLALELSNDALLKFRGKLASYDPNRSGPFGFLKRCADKIVLGHFRRQANRYKRFADLDDTKNFRSLQEEEPEILGEHILRGMDEETRLAIHLELMDLLFDGPSPLHHLMSFILFKLLGIAPLEIVASYSHVPFRALAAMAKEQLLMAGASPDRTRANFKKLDKRLAGASRSVVERHSEAIHRDGPGQFTVGDTCLEDYYQTRREPEPHPQLKADRIVQWWSSAAERLMTLALKKGSPALQGALKKSTRYLRRKKKKQRTKKTSRRAKRMR